MSTVPEKAVPPAREFTLLGISYGLYAFGLLTFWPAIAGVLLAYIRRGDAAGTFLESHYSWLIRTFWWWIVLFAVIICGIVATVLPGAIKLGKAASGGGIDVNIVNIPWSLLGGALLGGIALAIIWFWVVYRLIRGVLCLADGREVP